MIAHSCNACHPSNWQVVTGGSVQGHPQLRGQFKVTLGYMSLLFLRHMKGISRDHSDSPYQKKASGS